MSSHFPGGGNAFDTVAYEHLGHGRVRLAPFPEQPRSSAPRVYRVDTLKEAIRLLELESPPKEAASGDGPRPPFTLARDRDDLFVLSIATDRTSVFADHPIAIRASLRYVGDERATVSGPYGSFVAFGVEQLDGPIDTGPGWPPSCGFDRFAPGEVHDVPFAKSGGYDAGGSMADFWQGWFADPVLRLPHGHYVITAYAHHAGLGPFCFRDPSSTLNASVKVEVLAPPTLSPSSMLDVSASAGGTPAPTYRPKSSSSPTSRKPRAR